MTMDVQSMTNSTMIRPHTVRIEIVKTKEGDVWIAYRFLVSGPET